MNKQLEAMVAPPGPTGDRMPNAPPSYDESMMKQPAYNPYQPQGKNNYFSWLTLYRPLD